MSGILNNRQTSGLSSRDSSRNRPQLRQDPQESLGIPKNPQESVRVDRRAQVSWQTSTIRQDKRDIKNQTKLLTNNSIERGMAHHLAASISRNDTQTNPKTKTPRRRLPSQRPTGAEPRSPGVRATRAGGPVRARASLTSAAIRVAVRHGRHANEKRTPNDQLDGAFRHS